MIPVKVKRRSPDVSLPVYATDGAGAFDLRAYGLEKPMPLNTTLLIETGLSFEIPEGHAMFLFSRSGHGILSNVRLSNCVGVIDSDYRGEVKVKLTKDWDWGSILVVKNGDRIAQGIVLPVDRVQFIEQETLSETARGDGGFGSTGA